MSWTVTADEMIAEVRNRGGYRRSTTLTDEILLSFLNYGIGEVHDLIVKHNPTFLMKSVLVTAATGTAFVEIPDDFYKLCYVGLLDGDEVKRIRPYTLDDAKSWGSSGPSEVGYMLQSGSVATVPGSSGTPPSVLIWYIPHATKLVNGTDEYDGVNGHEDLIYEHALARCARREKQDVSDHVQEIARLEKRLLSALEAMDTSEPNYLPDLGQVLECE